MTILGLDGDQRVRGRTKRLRAEEREVNVVEEGRNGLEATQWIDGERPEAKDIALAIHHPHRRRRDAMTRRSGCPSPRSQTGGGQGNHPDDIEDVTYPGHARMRITKAYRRLGVEAPVTLPSIRRAFLRLWYEKPPQQTAKNHQIGLLNAYNILKAVLQGKALPRTSSLHSRPRHIASVSETRDPSDSLILHGAVGASWWAA